jgi:hypothetical protein
VWNEGKSKWDKQPVSAHTGKTTDVTAPTSWSTFDLASAQFQTHGAAHSLGGLGFVLGYDSGITGVDLDDVFTSTGGVLSELRYRIADALNSYTELSPSRTGLHVLTRATFAGGRRAEGVEVYGQGRFFTVTGEPFGSPRALALRQAEIDGLVSEIDAKRQQSAPAPLNWLAEPRMDDRAVYDMAAHAQNGAKFLDLWEGRWQQHYASQSEADYALINILGFYSDAPTQIARMWHMTALAQRDKGRRQDYVSGMIARSQDRKPPLVAIPTLPAVVSTSPVVQANTGPVYDSAPAFDAEDAEESAVKNNDCFIAREGMVKVIADWFAAQSIYPMPELALVGALGLMAGIVGRQYQFQKQGLNLYMLFLAETGAGKDALGTGMSRIFDAVCTTPPDFIPTVNNLNGNGCPAARTFMGPSRLSGKGLLRKFEQSDSLSMVSVLPEFSQTITSMAHKNANEGLRDFQHVLLEFYTKSAHGATYSGSMNADKAKDIAPLLSPAFTMLCEGTPGRFYKALNEDMVTDGLMARFIVIEREGYAEHNPSFAQFAEVPVEIKDYITKLCLHVLQLKQNGDVRIDVNMTPEAEAYSERLREDYRKRGVSSASEVHKFLWLRAHQNLSRIAALVAVSCDPFRPVVTADQLHWANKIIYRQCMLIVGKFRRGEVGMAETNDAEQYQLLRQTIEKFVACSPDTLRSYPKTTTDAKLAGLIPYSFLQTRLANQNAFKTDRRGSSAALKAIIETAIRAGLLNKARLNGSNGDFYSIEV